MTEASKNLVKPLLVVIMQWFYLVLGLIFLIGVFFYQNLNFVPSLGIANEFIIGAILATSGYCLILSISFFRQNTNLLILALVFIFFSTIAAVGLLLIGLPNANAVISGNLPSCVKNISTCTTSEGIVVASAAFLALAIPALLLNILSIIAAVKGIAASD